MNYRRCREHCEVRTSRIAGKGWGESSEWLTRREEVLSTKQGNHRKLEVEAEHVSGMSQGLWGSPRLQEELHLWSAENHVLDGSELNMVGKVGRDHQRLRELPRLGCWGIGGGNTKPNDQKHCHGGRCEVKEFGDAECRHSMWDSWEPHSCQQEPGAEPSPPVHVDVKERGGPRAESCNW